MICSFADVVALSPHPFCRPVINESGPLVIKGGRHFIISSKRAKSVTSSSTAVNSSFIANDCFISEGSNFQIISGPNGAVTMT
jgi:DNA mismatch repair ATPase MutS